jgi:hypothetical protein
MEVAGNKISNQSMKAFAQMIQTNLLVDRLERLMLNCCYDTPSRLYQMIKYGSVCCAFALRVQNDRLTREFVQGLPLHAAQWYGGACQLVLAILLIKLFRSFRVPRTLIHCPGAMPAIPFQ